jgi:hypothetical protein
MHRTCLLLAIGVASGATPVKGPYTPESSTFTSSTMDSSDQRIDVVAPKGEEESVYESSSPAV